MRRFGTAVGVALVLSACGPQGSGAPPGAAAPVGNVDGEWRLTEGRSPSGAIPVPSKVTLTIKGAEISGTAACNGYSGNATIEGTSFTTAGVGRTEMGCPGKRMVAEDRYAEALTAANTIMRNGDRLVLTGPDVDLRFALVPPPEPVSLENTTWHLGGLVYGRGPSGMVSDNVPATLTLRDDGTLTGSTGCRKMTGQWEQSGGVYRTTGLTASGPFRCPEHRHDQDAHVLDVLDGEFTVKLDVRAMEVAQTHGENALDYRADP